MNYIRYKIILLSSPDSNAVTRSQLATKNILNDDWKHQYDNE